MSPTAIFTRAALPVNTCVVAVGAGGGVPGVWGYGRVREGLYRYPTQTSSRTHISHILSLRPYLRPNEGEIRYIDEVSQIGSRMGPDMVQN